MTVATSLYLIRWIIRQLQPPCTYLERSHDSCNLLVLTKTDHMTIATSLYLLSDHNLGPKENKDSLRKKCDIILS